MLQVGFVCVYSALYVAKEHLKTNDNSAKPKNKSCYQIPRPSTSTVQLQLTGTQKIFVL